MNIHIQTLRFPLLVTFALLFLAGCPEAKDDSAAKEEGDPEETLIAPKAGTWTLTMGAMSGDCESEIPAGETTEMLVAEASTEGFTFSVPQMPSIAWSCTLDGADFDCPLLLTDYAEDQGYRVEFQFAWRGVLHSETSMEGALIQHVSCEGSCEKYDEVPNCDSEYAFNGLAL